MSYQQKLEEARALLTVHNSQIPSDSKEGRVETESFFSQLTKAGGTNEASLAQCTWEDLQDFGLPKLLARQVASVFRVKEKEEKTVFKRSKVDAMGISELIEHYDPRDKTSLISKRLNELLPGKRFLVFNEDSSFNIQESIKLAQELIMDYPERDEYVLVNGIPMSIYRVGERPDQSFEENPLYPGRVLRLGGDCDQTNRSWSGVPLEIRQIVYLAVSKTGEVKINSLNDSHNIMDLVMGESALQKVRQRYVKATANLREMIREGKAPLLRIFKKPVEKTNKSNDPFGTNRSY